jgi:hypothetical protein
MAVMVPRETWTDGRLDDLNRKLDYGFARLDQDIRELRRELSAQGDSLRSEMNARFDALNRNLFAFAAAIIAALIGIHAF